MHEMRTFLSSSSNPKSTLSCPHVPGSHIPMCCSTSRHFYQNRGRCLGSQPSLSASQPTDTFCTKRSISWKGLLIFSQVHLSAAAAVAAPINTAAALAAVLQGRTWDPHHALYLFPCQHLQVGTYAPHTYASSPTCSAHWGDLSPLPPPKQLWGEEGRASRCTVSRRCGNSSLLSPSKLEMGDVTS